MPQMYPINWVSMFIFISMIFYLVNSFLYFLTSFNTPKKDLKKIQGNEKNSWKLCW